MPRSAAGRFAAALALAVTLCASGPVLADEPTETQLAAARQLFNEGKELEKQNQWAEALARFKKVGEVKMTPQVRFHIALCDENLGRLVSAINGYELAADEAKQSAALASDVAGNAPARAEALRKRVPQVQLVVKGRLTTSKVLLDGSPVAPALMGTNIPVDPGTHTVDVETDGQNAFHKEFTLQERAREIVELELNDPEVAATSVAQPPGTAPPPGSPPPPPQESDFLAFPPPLPAIIAGGVGLAALVGAGVFVGLRQQTISEVRDSCSDPERDSGCDPDLKSIADRGETYTIVADVLFGVGGAGLLAGAVLWIALPGPKRDASNGTAIRVAPTPAGVRVNGTF
jgi:hypothetical protein